MLGRKRSFAARKLDSFPGAGPFSDEEGLLSQSHTSCSNRAAFLSAMGGGDGDRRERSGEHEKRLRLRG